MSEDQGARPHEVIKVIRGNPTDEELAAVLSVLVTRSSQDPAAEKDKSRSGWAAYWRGVRAPIRPGPDSWRAAVRR